MQRTGLICLLAIMTVLAACDSGPALRVTDIQVIAPAPGRTASVAYLKLSNNSGDAVALTAISSPQFGRVEMHETVLADGVARMQALHSISIEAGSQIEFKSGGKHIMLLDPVAALLPGKSVSLHLHYDEDGLLIVDVPLSTRAAE